MAETTGRIPTWTLGIDLGDRSAHYCWVTGGGVVEEEGTVLQTVEPLRQLVQSRGPHVRVAFEVGTHSGWVSDLFLGLGHEVFVANSRRMKLIARSQRKTDKADAELLARLARSDPSLLCPIQHRSSRARADLQMLRSREALVSARTSLVNHVRGAVKAAGGRVPPCSTGSFHKTAPKHLPESLQGPLLAVLDTIATLSEQIRAMDREVEQLCEQQYAETALLTQVVGVGPITALCFVLTLDDPDRFSSSRMVGPYLGLCPRVSQSGARDPELRITKAGDTQLRRLLVTAAHYVLGPFGPPTDLRQWGQRMAAKGGKNAKKRAVVAVARKLAVLLHSLWKHGTVYEPLRAESRKRRSA